MESVLRAARRAAAGAADLSADLVPCRRLSTLFAREPLKIFMATTEEAGDAAGAALVDALRQEHQGALEVVGVVS